LGGAASPLPLGRESTGVLYASTKGSVAKLWKKLNLVHVGT